MQEEDVQMLLSHVNDNRFPSEEEVEPEMDGSFKNISDQNWENLDRKKLMQKVHAELKKVRGSPNEILIFFQKLTNNFREVSSTKQFHRIL